VGRRLIVVLAVVVLFATGCRTEKQTPAAQSPTSEAAPQRFPVQIDGRTDAFNGVFTGFFPKTLSVHPGDSVKYDMPHFTGEPHTVTLGTLADAGVAKIEQLGGPQPKFAEEAEPQLVALTDIFPHATPPGPPVPNQSAAQPCYLDSGEPPHSATGGAPACPSRTQPEFNGKQSFYNSGALIKDGDAFEVKTSKDIAPGTYSVFCLVHRSAMFGKLTVAPGGTSVPSPDEVRKAGSDELAKVVSALKPAADEAAAATPDKAVAGAGVPTVFDALVAEFGPKEASVPTGGSVTWNGFGFHTISLDASQGDVGVLTRGADGSFGFNIKVFAPADSAGQAPGYSAFPQTETKPAAINGGRFDGSAVKSSGLMVSLPPLLTSYKVTFTKPGTYEVRCLLHPDMKGKVKVG
jgi:plastocyanin